MKTLYSSSFFSIILAFGMFMGYHQQPFEVVQTGKRIHFSNVILTEPSFPPDKIRIEVFDNFTCDHCSEFAKRTLPKIRDLKLEDRRIDLHLYFVPNINDESLFEKAMALKCAGDQNRYWNIHLAMHENKESFDIKKIAKDLKMDINTFEQCMSEKKHQSGIEQDIQYASEKEITISPTILINQYKLVGNQPFENIQNIIKKIQKEREINPTFNIENIPTDIELDLSPLN